MVQLVIGKVTLVEACKSQFQPGKPPVMLKTRFALFVQTAVPDDPLIVGAGSPERQILVIQKRICAGGDCQIIAARQLSAHITRDARHRPSVADNHPIAGDFFDQRQIRGVRVCQKKNTTPLRMPCLLKLKRISDQGNWRRLTPAPNEPAGVAKTPAPRPASPVLFRAERKAVELKPCTLPSAKPTLPCLEWPLSCQPIAVATVQLAFVPALVNCTVFVA